MSVTQLDNKSARRVLAVYSELLSGRIVTHDWWGTLEATLSGKSGKNERAFARDIAIIRQTLQANDSAYQVVHVPDGYLLQADAQAGVDQKARIIAEVLLASRFFARGDLDQLLAQVAESLPVSMRKQWYQQLKPALGSYVPITHTQDNLQQLELLITAITEQRQVTFHYRKSSATEVKTYVGQPQTLYFETNYFYVIMQLNGHLTMFRIDRMTSIDCQFEGHAPLKETFSIRNHRETAANLAMGKQIQFGFDTSLPLDMIRDRFPTAKVTKQTANTAHVEALAYEQGALLWLRSQGADVKVTSPQDLARTLKKKALEVAALYANI